MASATVATTNEQIMEEFGSWFRNLRQEIRRKNRPGHSNPVVLLREGTSTSGSATGRVMEVVDPYSHILRLEEVQRDALMSAEAQWRLFFHRQGAFPRGPAMLAVRMRVSEVKTSAAAQRIVQQESACRQALEEARFRWMDEISDRAKYELETLAETIRKEIRLQLFGPRFQRCEKDESFSRSAIEDVYASWSRNVEVAMHAGLTHIANRVMQAASLQQQFSRTAVSVRLDAEQSHMRSSIQNAEEEHFQALKASLLQHSARLMKKYQSEAQRQFQHLRTDLGRIFMAEEQSRNSLMDAECHMFEVFKIQAMQDRARWQADVLEKMKFRVAAARVLQERVEKDIIEGEVSNRVHIVEAYMRWIEEVVVKQMAVLRSMQAREQCTAMARHAACEKHMDQVVSSEARARAVLVAAFDDWLRNQIVPLELMERADIPRRVAQRLEMLMQTMLIHQTVRSTPFQLLQQDEFDVRSQIERSERNWRSEMLDAKWAKMCGWSDAIREKVQQFDSLEQANRNQIVQSEARWRQFVAQSLRAALAKCKPPTTENERPKSRSLFSL